MDDYNTDDYDDPNAYGDDWDEYDEFSSDADDYREMEKDAANPIPVCMSKAELEKLLFSGLNAELESTRKFYKDLLDLWCSDK